MNAFEFGCVVGASEKSANIGNAFLEGAIKLNPLVHGAANAALGAPIGAALGAYNAPSGQKLRGAGRGALTGAATGAGVGAATALAGKAIGGFPGMIERSFAGGLKNNLINQIPNVAGIGGGVAGYQLAKNRPQPQAKAANALAVAKPLVGQLVRQAPLKTTVVPRAAQAGSNAMKYLGAGAAGLAGGLLGAKMMGGKAEQQPQAKVAFAPQPGASNFGLFPKIGPQRTSVMPTSQPTLRPGLPPAMQQQQRQKFEQGVGKMFGQTAQKVVGGLNTASDMLRRHAPPVMHSGNI